MGSDVELLQLNFSIDLEPLSIRSNHLSTDAILLNPQFWQNVTIKKKHLAWLKLVPSSGIDTSGDTNISLKIPTFSQSSRYSSSFIRVLESICLRICVPYENFVS